MQCLSHQLMHFMMFCRFMDSSLSAWLLFRMRLMVALMVSICCCPMMALHSSILFKKCASCSIGSKDVIVAFGGTSSNCRNMAINWGNNPSVVRGLKCLQTMYRSEFA